MKAFPAAVQGGVQSALEMVREMSEALTDLAQHQLAVLDQSGSGDNGNVEVARLRANDKDELVLVTRKEADAAGEARISLRMAKDDGEEIPSHYHLGLRIDLERRGTPSIDVQLGKSALDKRAHGIWRGTDGRSARRSPLSRGASGLARESSGLRGDGRGVPASTTNQTDAANSSAAGWPNLTAVWSGDVLAKVQPGLA